MKKQTGLTMGDYTAYILSGQNPSFPSEVSRFAKKLLKKRRKGKTLKEDDVDALLDMVMQFMQYQEMSGRDRTAFCRTVLQKVVPALSSTDLEAETQKELYKFEVTDDFRKAVKKEINKGI